MGQWDRDRQETKQVSEFKQCPKEGTVAQSTGGSGDSVGQNSLSAGCWGTGAATQGEQ